MAIQNMHNFLDFNGLWGKEFCLLSYGDFDGLQLRNEIMYRANFQSENVYVPNYFKRWINLKKVFPTHLFDKSMSEVSDRDVSRDYLKEKARVGELPETMKLVGLEFEG